MSFFMLGADKKLKKDNKLVKLNLLIDWSKVKKHLKRIHKMMLIQKAAPRLMTTLRCLRQFFLDNGTP